VTLSQPLQTIDYPHARYEVTMKSERSECEEKSCDKCQNCQEDELLLYWCEQCNQAIAEKRCPLCGLKARRMKPGNTGHHAN
jgi:hypothetical protein